jgi:hypothetical protein
MRRSWVVGVIGVLAGGGIAVAFMSTSKSPGQPRAEATTESERERLQREVLALRREALALRAAQAAQEPGSASGGERVPQRLHRGPGAANDLEWSHAENEAQLAALADTLRVEPRDPSWSRGAEQRLSEALRSQVAPGTELVSVECRTTLCGVTLKHDDLAARRAVPHLVGLALPYAARIVYAYSTDGSATTVYVSREDRDLGVQ